MSIDYIMGRGQTSSLQTFGTTCQQYIDLALVVGSPTVGMIPCRQLVGGVGKAGVDEILHHAGFSKSASNIGGSSLRSILEEQQVNLVFPKVG